jgi:hypothetical protein
VGAAILTLLVLPPKGTAVCVYRKPQVPGIPAFCGFRVFGFKEEATQACYAFFHDFFYDTMSLKFYQ